MLLDQFIIQFEIAIQSESVSSETPKNSSGDLAKEVCSTLFESDEGADVKEDEVVVHGITASDAASAKL